jgi:hypothetical protein
MASDSRQDALVRAMPVVFVLIWSTGFIVARYGMPNAPPMKFLALRYVLSVLCFAAWALFSGARFPVGRRQLAHLAVTGVLMHAGYLGGVWTAVKLGMGAGLAALLVSLQPVLTAIWVSSRGGHVTARQWSGLALGFTGLGLVVWHKLGLGEIHPANLLCAFVALVSITVGTLYQKRFVTPCDVRTANLVQLAAAFDRSHPLERRNDRRHGVVGAGLDAGRQLAAVPVDPARRGDGGHQPAVPGAALHGADGLAVVRRADHRADPGRHGAHRIRSQPGGASASRRARLTGRGR